MQKTFKAIDARVNPSTGRYVQRALVHAGLTDSAADLIEEMDTFTATSATALPR